MAPPPTEGGGHRRTKLGSIALIYKAKPKIASLERGFCSLLSPLKVLAPTTYTRIETRDEVTGLDEVGCSNR